MRSEKRKSPRRKLNYPAWIDLGDGKKLPCLVADVSQTGARIRTTTLDAVRDELTLEFSRGGKTRRICRVVWRSPNALGVRFVGPDHAE